MAKKVSFLVAIFFAFFVKSNAMSLMNNTNVPSDILMTMLFDGMQNSIHLENISIPNEGIYDSEKCILALEQIVNGFPNLDVLPFLDSWGKFPSGILYGHSQAMGNFDQCVRIATQLNETTGILNGQYCFASTSATQNEFLPLPGLMEQRSANNENAAASQLSLKIGICIPDICDPSLVQAVFQNAANQMFNGTFPEINIDQCVTAKKPDFKAVNILGIVIFSIFGALMALSTAYEIFTDYLEKPAMPLLLAFSVITNGRKLFAISTSKSPNSIDCLTGIRVLSMTWVVYCHNHLYFLVQPIINLIDLIPWMKAASSMHVMEASVSVDTFLFISGLLVAWLGFRELDRSKGKLNVLMMYFHRYIRLTPAIAAVILYYVSIQEYAGTGPLIGRLIGFNKFCQTTWWSTLLYVQNYVHPDKLCVGQSWYLAVDTQLYVISPLILILLWKWGKRFVPVLFLMSLLSIGCIIATFFAEGYDSLGQQMKPKNMRLIYVPTHTRYSVWLVGIGFGYFMHVNRNKSMRLSKTLQLLGWIISFTTILAIIYAPYFTINADRAVTVLEAALYESLKRPSWALALAWIVFACHYGFGGIVNTILSHPWWQPLGRLTYSMYLVHMAVQSFNFGITRTDAYFSNYTQVTRFWSSFGTSLMAAIVLTLAFESPVLGIEKVLLGGGSKRKDTAITDTTIIITNCESVDDSQKTA